MQRVIRSVGWRYFVPACGRPNVRSGVEFRGSRGDKDQSYQEILNSSKLWEKGRYQYRFINVPGMGHRNAPADSLEEALKWIGL